MGHLMLGLISVPVYFQIELIAIFPDRSALPTMQPNIFCSGRFLMMWMSASEPMPPEAMILCGVFFAMFWSAVMLGPLRVPSLLMSV